METWLVVLLGIAVISVFIGIRVHENRTWTEFYAAPGHRPDTASRLHSALHHKGIRCRLQVVGLGHNFAGSLSQTVKVLVHRDDLHLARQVRAELRDV